MDPVPVVMRLVAITASVAITGAIIFAIPSAVVGSAVLRWAEAMPHWALVTTNAIIAPLTVGIVLMQAARRRSRARKAARMQGDTPLGRRS